MLGACRGWLWILLLTLLLGLATAAGAAEEPDTGALSTRLDTLEKTLKQRHLTLDRLGELAKQATAIKGKALACVEQTANARDEVQKILDSLGEAAKGEPREVTHKRAEVKKRLRELEGREAACKVLALRSDEALQTIGARTKQILARQLLARGPDVFELLRENWQQAPAWLAETEAFVQRHSGLEGLKAGHWLALLAALGLAAGLGVMLRRGLMRRLQRLTPPVDFAGRFLVALQATLARHAPALLASCAVALVIYIIVREEQPPPFIAILAYGLPPLFLFSAVVRLVLAPPRPAVLFIRVPRSLARALSRRLRVLALLAYIGYLLFSTLLLQSLPEEALLLARALFVVFLLANLAWAFSLILRFPRLAHLRWLALLIHLSLFIVLVAEWTGYRNLAQTLIVDVLATLLAFGLILLAQRLLRDVFENLESASGHWGRRLRAAMNLPPEARIPGLRWLWLLVVLGLWTLFAYEMLVLWDVSDTLSLEIHTYLTQGFDIGSLHVVPAKIALAVLTAAVIVTLGGWLRGRLASTWLERTGMERGAREALVTMTGYLTVAIAVLAGLGVAGFEFGSLAIIAGALSVGIGFGLQNIVNNFVSGLILLFERPIKTGDWVMVGATEGYVKRIRIRSTQIQTFDRADVIVPNSELISAQVTNWMLKDPSGRIHVPVGVAYGSDTNRVKAILERIAAEHPMVITDGSQPEPWVLFRGFGDSSLDLELRCFIENIDRRLRVISDLNFAIDAAFREAGIEIPFPQRDLHVRDWPAGEGGDIGPAPLPEA